MQLAVVFADYPAQVPWRNENALPPRRPGRARRESGRRLLRRFAGASAALFEGTPAHAHPAKLQTALSRSRLREALLISLAVLEAVYLVGSLLGLV